MSKSSIRTTYYLKVEGSLRYNKQQFSMYLDYLEQSNLDSGSVKTYLSRITGFLKYLDRIEMTIEDLSSASQIIKYSKEENKELDYAFKAALKLFLSLAGKTTNIQITEQEIDKIDFKKENVRQASPLSVQEIIEIRNKLRQQNNYQHSFIFEIFLAYGIELDQFQYITRDDFSLDDNIFHSPSGDIQPLGKALAELLIKHEDIPESKVRGTLQGQIKQIGKLVKRDKLIWQDIIETRREYFPTCPECSNKFPNTEDFWALLEYKFDESKTRWLLCRSCARKRTKGNLNG